MLMFSATIVSSFHPFAYNYSIKLFLDNMSISDNLAYHDIMFPIFLFLTTQLSLTIIWRISDIIEWKTIPYVRRSIFLKTYDYIQHHSYSFFQDNFSGVISSKIKGILDCYDRLFAEMHHGLLAKILTIIINFFVLFMVHPNLGLFIFIWSAIYVSVMYKLSIKLNQLSFEETESRHNLIGQISDKITNIFSIILFSAKKREMQALDNKLFNDFIPKQIQVYKHNFVIQIISGILYFIMFAFILFYMIHLRIHELISIGDFAFVFGISLIMVEDIWHTTISLQDFTHVVGELKSALTVLYVPQQNLDRQNVQQLIIKEPKIEFKNISFGYDRTDSIFNDLNLVIKAGEKVGLVGKSGVGKSSLINLLLKYFKSTKGQILIDNQNIDNVTQDSLRENIALIPQDILLFNRTLMENIKYGKPDASDEEVIKASKKAFIHEFIINLPNQYNTCVGERGIKLSGGQRQRIAIARAILKNSPILILDEATSSLDGQIEKMIQRSLSVLIADHKKTVIAIAHRLSTLKHMDRIIVLNKGKIIEEGTHNTLMSLLK
ncbi:ABC transporter ATP-binding protein [Rickettsia endosymbiont of Nabis limbatus]|uniref:ABC transporter ATP-binding protein n=1 Tax=Rickettsia endosymbiont of Nabis limbatus TaxID=3066268 RepID=UPI003AF35946